MEPQLSLSQDSFDLGTVYTDDALRVIEVTVSNKGMKPLKISEARVDCDCTTVEYPEESIGPLGSETVKITVDLRGFIPMDIDKKVGLYSNDANSPAVINIKGVVKRKE